MTHCNNHVLDWFPIDEGGSGDLASPGGIGSRCARHAYADSVKNRLDQGLGSRNRWRPASQQVV
jgi:hypothetical protein